MDNKLFVQKTVNQMDDFWFTRLKNMLIGEYLSFAIIKEEDITRDILAEKVCDYFEKLELKTGKSFDKQLDHFITAWDSVVSQRIAEAPKQKKNEAPLPAPRARKYYDRARAVKNVSQLTLQHLVDYSRIMACLYTASLRSTAKVISDFDYSTEKVQPEEIMKALKEEKVSFPVVKKPRFDTKDLYSLDTGTFIVTIILMCHLKCCEIIGEY